MPTLNELRRYKLFEELRQASKTKPVDNKVFGEKLWVVKDYIENLQSSIEYEAAGSFRYKIMVEDARELGLTDEAIILENIAKDEDDHYKKLQSMLKRVERI